MTMNRYEIDAQLAERHARIRSDYRPRRGPRRRLTLPKLPVLPALRRSRSHRLSLPA